MSEANFNPENIRKDEESESLRAKAQNNFSYLRLWASSLQDRWEKMIQEVKASIIKPAIRGGFNVDDVRYYGTISNAIASIPSTQSKTLFVTNEQVVASNLTIPSNISIVVLKGGSFAISSGVTLTINGPFKAGLFQVISGSGTVTFLSNYFLEFARPEWWGAVGDDSTACATAINAALTACYSVKLATGRYRVNASLNLLTGSTLFGVHKHKSTLVVPTLAAAADLTVILATNKSDWTLRDFGIDGGSANYPDDTTTLNRTVTGIHTTLTYPTITAVHADLTSSLGTDANGKNCTVQDMHFENVTNFSIRFKRPTGSDSWRTTRINNNSFYKGAYQNQVLSVFGLENSPEAAYALNVSICGNQMKRSGPAKYLRPGQIGFNSSTDGIEINRCKNFVCTGNTVDTCAGIGIRTEACSVGVVTGNTVLESGQEGIVAYNVCRDVAIHTNTIRNWGRIPNVASLREYAGAFYIPRENPGIYTVGPPAATILFPANPSTSAWWEANPYYLQGVSSTTVPDYVPGTAPGSYLDANFYYEATAYAGNPAANPPTGFDVPNGQGVLAFRGFAAISVNHLSERISVYNNIIVGNLTKDGTTSESGALYNYASDYGINIVHPSNEPQAYNNPIILGANQIRKCIKSNVYLPSYVDPINRQGAIQAVRYYPGNFGFDADDRIAEISPGWLQNTLQSETIPALTFSAGGSLVVAGASRPAIGTGAFGILMYFKLTSALNNTTRYLLDMGIGGTATIGPKIHIRDNRIAFGVTDGAANHEITYTTITDWGVSPHNVLMLYCTRDSSGLRMLINSIPEVAGGSGAVGVNVDTGNSVGINYDLNTAAASDVPMELYHCTIWGQSFTRDQLFDRIHEKRLIRSGDTVLFDLDMQGRGGYYKNNASVQSIITASSSGLVSSEPELELMGAGSPESVTTGQIGMTYRDRTNGNLYVKRSGTGNTGWAYAGSSHQITLGSAVQTLSSTATNDDPTETVYQNRVATTDATVTTLHTFTIPATTTYFIKAFVVARRTGGSAGTAEDGASYEMLATYKNVAGTATLIGAAAIVANEDQAAWDCVFDVTGATARIRVTGAANNNVTWHTTARAYAVST